VETTYPLVEKPADALAALLRARREWDDMKVLIPLDGLLQLGIMVVRVSEVIQRRLWEQLFAGEPETQRPGRNLKSMYKTALPPLEEMEGLLAAAEAGQQCGHAEEFREARRRLLALHAEFTAHWPLLTAEDLAQGTAEIASGDYVWGEELLRELHAPDAP
jgi:hypothetical protein